MRVNKPDYYDNFICIADKCTFTCCQDWKITVDPMTLNRWKTTKIPRTMYTCENDESVGGQVNSRLSKIPFSSATYLSQFVIADMGGDKIELCENGKCPFLNEEGLCHIVREYGEEMISDTCHTFPRQRHEYADRVEYSLTMGCPAALDLLWEKECFAVSEKNEAEKVDRTAPYADNHLFLFRDNCIALMNTGMWSVADSIKMIFYIALDIYEKLSDKKSVEIEQYFDDKFLKDLFRAVYKVEKNETDSEVEQNELFLDISQNYREKGIYSDVLEVLAQQAEYYSNEENYGELVARRRKYAKQYEAVEKLLRTLFAEELHSTLVLPGADFVSVIIKLEWIGIIYAVLQNALFLRWDISSEKTDYESLKEIVMVIIRMTGYSDDDIEEYMEDCFEDIIWDWGYMSLIAFDI